MNIFERFCMPRFNPDKIAKLVSEMRKAVTRLQYHKTLARETFLSDPEPSLVQGSLITALFPELKAVTKYPRASFFRLFNKTASPSSDVRIFYSFY